MRVKLTDIYLGKRGRDMTEPETYKYVTQELAPDMRENGQITAITVKPVSDDDKELPDYGGQPWKLLAGGCRIAASILNGWTEIEAFNRADPIDAVKEKIIELHENIKRKAMTFDEEAKLRRELLALRRLQDPNITAAEVAKEIGETPANFSRHVAVAKAIEEDPHLINAGSAKAVLRVRDLSAELKGRMARSTEDAAVVQKMDLEQRMVVADMQDWLRVREDESADLTVVDFPYGGNYWKSGHKTRKGSKGVRRQASLSQYNDTPEYANNLMIDCIPEIMRTTRVTGWVVLFGNFDSYLFMKSLVQDCCAVHFDYRETPEDRHCMSSPNKGDLVCACRYFVPEALPWHWYRPNSQNNPRYPELHPKNYLEYMLVVNRGAARLRFKPGQSSIPNVFVHDAEYGTDRFHANQKPVELYEDIIFHTTDMGATIVDPCAGSFASCCAAAKHRRFFWACDKNQALLAPARGFVARHVVSMAGLTEGRRQVAALEVPPEELEDTTEMPVEPAIRIERHYTMAELEYYAEPAMRVVEDGDWSYIAYIKNAARQVWMVRGRSGVEADTMAFDFATRLNEIVEEGRLDPAQATSEAIQLLLQEDELLQSANTHGEDEENSDSIGELEEAEELA